MKKQLLLFLFFWNCIILFGQTPNISYTTPDTYVVGSTITPLSPVNTGGAVPATIYGQVSTLAGTAPTIYQPNGVAVDSGGNVYEVDPKTNRILKISATGVVTILAGSDTAGSADGTGAAASFNSPAGVAVDLAGNVYVADTGNHKIRKITTVGVVTTLAGSGVSGSADGTGTAASFSYPNGVAVDLAGNVYVADSGNTIIRKITTAGLVTTLAGSGTVGSADGTGTSANFYLPEGVSVDSAGNVYVADTYNNKIRKITAAGIVTTLAGSGVSGSTDGTGTASRFNWPWGVTVDSAGNVYVGDKDNHIIRKITTAGVVTTLAGSGVSGSADGTGIAASFYYPYGVAVDSADNVYVADSSNHKIRKISAAGVVTTLAGSGSLGSADGTGATASFNSPYGVTVDSAGNTYVSDVHNNKIRKITVAGVVTTLAGSGAIGSADGTGTAASFNSPSGVAVDSAGNLYVADIFNNKIRKISATGVVTTFAGNGNFSSVDGTNTAASFADPYGVAVDSAGNVYVADSWNHKIRKITADGMVTTLAGNGAVGSADGTGTAASFNFPEGVAVDLAGNVYVADSGNNIIRKITATGVVTTLAGNGSFGSTDGTGSAASFYSPSSVAVDLTGNVYVADTSNSKIRKITSDGVVTTLAGSGSFGSADGTGKAASFADPYGVAVDSGGNVYVADTNNNIIRKITTIGYVINPTLVAGLSFDSATGIISGTPTVALGATNYTVTAYNTAGSSSTTVNITVGTLSINSFEVSNNLRIYPNPASSNVTVELKNLNNASLEVIDITGKEVMKQNLNLTSNLVNIEKLPSGMYFFKVNCNQGSATSKVVKN